VGKNAAAPVYPNAASLIPNNIAALDNNGQLSLNGSGKLLRDGNITPIGGVSFVDSTKTFDKNYAVNTIFSKNLQSHGGDPNAASLLPSQNDSNPNDAARPFIVNIGDLLSAANVTWKWYSGGWNNALDSSPSNPVTQGAPNTVNPLFQWHHQPFAFFDNYAPFTTDLANHPDGRNPVSAAHLQDKANFYQDVANNTLPAVSFVKFLGPDNEHPGYASLQQGQQHVADLVAQVQAQPQLWARTLIVITYDEHGGRWDHVTPPARDIWGPGVRVPAIIISPFARQGYVDHTPYDTSSILKTIEQRFGLPALTAADANAASLAGAFTNAQLKRSGYSVNRRLGRVTQVVTVTNAGSLPLAGPINVVLDNLSANTTLANASGATANNPPVGSPYIVASSGDLAPGASVSVTLQFTIPNSGGITYSARTVTGTPNP